MGLSERRIGEVYEGADKFVVWARDRQLQAEDPAPGFRYKFIKSAR